MSRRARLVLSAALLLSFAPSAAPPLRADEALGRCTIATKGPSPVAAACKAGGIPRAKAVMKEMQRVGKRAGVRFLCDDCHKDPIESNWTLGAAARERFKQLLAVQGERAAAATAAQK